MKKYIILLFIVFSNFSFAETEIKANIAAENILKHAIYSISELKNKQKKVTLKQIKNIVKKDFLPFIDATFSAEQSLKNHWHNLSNTQKITLENYIINSLINDYANILISFNNYKKIKITISPKIKTHLNKAIVSINFSTYEDNKMTMVAAKMIKKNSWKIYDIVFSGVSLIKNYSASFESYIKRKGFDAFSKKYLNPSNG